MIVLKKIIRLKQQRIELQSIVKTGNVSQTKINNYRLKSVLSFSNLIYFKRGASVFL